MIVKLLTEHHLEFLSLREAAQARLSLHLSKCHIVGITCHSSLIAQKHECLGETFLLSIPRKYQK